MSSLQELVLFHKEVIVAYSFTIDLRKMYVVRLILRHDS